MERPTIKIESDGVTAKVCLNGEEIKCTSLDFHGDVQDGLHIKWDGVMQKLNENGEPCVVNSEVATEEFHYDSREVVQD